MQRRIGLPTVCVFVYCLTPSPAAQVTPGDLDRILEQTGKRRDEYVEAFKGLTAVETKLTEIIDKNGKTQRQQKVVSDFLVYQSQTGALVSEYRIAREVDGKPVANGDKQAVALFERLARARTLEQEARRLREENLKYRLKYFRWGITLQPLQQLARPSDFVFEIAGRENVGGRDAILLTYRQKELARPGPSGLMRNLKDPRTGNRGRVWLDAEDFRIWRWENESTVVDRDITSEAVFARDEIEYESGALGLLLPKKIVTDFFDEKTTDKRGLRLGARITYTYDAFKRFTVNTDFDVQTPQ